MVKKIPEQRFQNEETRKPQLLAAALADDGSLRDRIREYSEDDSAKLLLLCQHYGIQASPIMFYELALALARKLYPEPKKRGRKSKWTLLNQGVLVVEIERLAKPDNPAHGVAWACKEIAKREPWKSFLEIKESDTTNPDPAEALRQTYYNFRADKWAEVERDAFKSCELAGAVEVWEKHVFDYVNNPKSK